MTASPDAWRFADYLSAGDRAVFYALLGDPEPAAPEPRPVALPASTSRWSAHAVTVEIGHIRRTVTVYRIAAGHAPVGMLRYPNGWQSDHAEQIAAARGNQSPHTNTSNKENNQP